MFKTIAEHERKAGRKVTDGEDIEVVREAHDQQGCKYAASMRPLRSLKRCFGHSPAMASGNCWLWLNGKSPYKAFSCHKNRFVVHLFYITSEHTNDIQHATVVTIA
jgi:hypothetical protein